MHVISIISVSMVDRSWDIFWWWNSVTQVDRCASQTTEWDNVYISRWICYSEQDFHLQSSMTNRLHTTSESFGTIFTCVIVRMHFRIFHRLNVDRTENVGSEIRSILVVFSKVHINRNNLISSRKLFFFFLAGENQHEKAERKRNDRKQKQKTERIDREQIDRDRWTMALFDFRTHGDQMATDGRVRRSKSGKNTSQTRWSLLFGWSIDWLNCDERTNMRRNALKNWTKNTAWTVCLSINEFGIVFCVFSGLFLTEFNFIFIQIMVFSVSRFCRVESRSLILQRTEKSALTHLCLFRFRRWLLTTEMHSLEFQFFLPFCSFTIIRWFHVDIFPNDE